MYNQAITEVYDMIDFQSFENLQVKKAFDNYPKVARDKLLAVRQMIFDVAKKTKGVGKIEETLKWNEPSYITIATKSGSAIRIDWKKKDKSNYHIYINCQTKLVEIFKTFYPDEFNYIENRCISIPINKKVDEKKLAHIIELALTYNNIKDDF